MPEHPLILKTLYAGLVGCLLLAIGPLFFPYLDFPYTALAGSMTQGSKAAVQGLPSASAS